MADPIESTNIQPAVTAATQSDDNVSNPHHDQSYEQLNTEQKHDSHKDLSKDLQNKDDDAIMKHSSVQENKTSNHKTVSLNDNLPQNHNHIDIQCVDEEQQHTLSIESQDIEQETEVTDEPQSQTVSVDENKVDQESQNNQQHVQTQPAIQNVDIYTYGDGAAVDHSYPPQQQIIQEAVEIQNLPQLNTEKTEINQEQKEPLQTESIVEDNKDPTNPSTDKYTYEDAQDTIEAQLDEEQIDQEQNQETAETENAQESNTENNEINQEEKETLQSQTEDSKDENVNNIDANAQLNEDRMDKEQDEEHEEIQPAIHIEEEHMVKDRPSWSLSPRITVLKETWANKRRFSGNTLPLVVCLRCNNHFFVEKTEEHFTATARQRNLKYAFTLIADSSEEDVYQLIHIQSASYLSVKQNGKYWILYPVNDDDLSVIGRKDLCFTVCKISDENDVNLRVTIGWNDKYLTMKEAEDTVYTPKKPDLQQIDEMNTNNCLQELHDTEPVFDEDEGDEAKDTGDIMPGLQTRTSSLAHLDGTDKVLVFAEAYTENIDDQVFTLERIMDDVEDEELNVMFLLDLVYEARVSKIGIPPHLSKRFKHIPVALNELIQQIYIRIDVNKTGYAPYNDVWSQFVQYSAGMVPRVVITAFEDGVCAHDVCNKLIHIKNMISAIDTIIEFYENEIKMERLQEERRRELKKLDPIDIKLRRLDSDILCQHPLLLEWRNMSSFRRTLYDWKIYILDKWNSDGSDIGFFLWRTHLVTIQSNFGESIFAFFQFTRWLMTLNLIMALFYGLLIFTHCLNFSFASYSLGEYVNMGLGNEFLHSWWFYGAYKSEYDSVHYLSYDIQFLWVVLSVCCLVISVIAVLRVLLMAGIKEDNEYIFSLHVFANYNHSLQHCDAVTLQRNSLMIRLHETLLRRIDEEHSKLTCWLLTKRLIGIALCLIIGVISGVGIAALIYFEQDIIIPYAHNMHYSMKSMAPYIVPAGVSVIKAMTPHIVRAIVKFEDYSAEFLFQQTFFRVFILRIFAILVTLFQTAQTAENTENDEGAACAESQIGMVLYKFILFDMMIEIVVYCVVPAIKYCCGRCCGSIRKLTKEQELDELNRRSTLQTAAHTQSDDVKSAKSAKTVFELAGDSWKAEFDIPGALVDVMYRQGIVWSGMYFSPMIPVMAVIASVSTFFVKKSYLLRYCSRPKKALGVTKQLKFFYGMMLIAIIVSFVPLNYFLNRTPNCGPHYEQNVLHATATTLDQDMPSFLRTFFSYAFNGLLLLPLFILTLVYLGYVGGLRNVHALNAKQLKQRLLKEKDEKRQILNDYNIRL